MSRRRAREEVFKLVFESEIKGADPKEISDEYFTREDALDKEDEADFIKRYMNGISSHLSDIMKEIESNMTGWSFERIGFVERSVLKYSVYELLYEEIPTEIIVNEAVEICKKYGTDKTPDFINGVLARIIKNKK